MNIVDLGGDIIFVPFAECPCCQDNIVGDCSMECISSGEIADTDWFPDAGDGAVLISTELSSFEICDGEQLTMTINFVNQFVNEAIGQTVVITATDVISHPYWIPISGPTPAELTLESLESGSIVVVFQYDASQVTADDITVECCLVQAPALEGSIDFDPPGWGAGGFDGCGTPNQ